MPDTNLEKHSDEKYLSMVIKYENIIKEYQSKVQTLLDDKRTFTSKMENIFTQQQNSQNVSTSFCYDHVLNDKIKSLQS